MTTGTATLPELHEKFRLNPDGTIVCRHRDISCCPDCAADPRVVAVHGAHYAIEDPEERAMLRALLAESNDIAARRPDVVAEVGTVPLTRAAAGIDAAVALLSRPDGNLADVAMLLDRLASADPDAISTTDATARVQGLCAFAAQRLRELFSDDLRSAPPAALSELLGESMRDCVNPLCGERVAPWDDAACTPACAAQAHRLGEL